MTERHFRPLRSNDKEMIWSWLSEPHVQEFWDNTPEHRADIENFLAGRIEPSNYADGKYYYWVACESGRPYAMLMSIEDTPQDDLHPFVIEHLSRTGQSYAIDFMIGEKDFLGKGLAAPTLHDFVLFLRQELGDQVDTFLIDPTLDNPRARRVYEKAGFEYVGDFIMGADSSGSGHAHTLLKKTFLPAITLSPIKESDSLQLETLSLFYLYDLSRSCGHQSSFAPFPQIVPDYRSYRTQSNRRALFICLYDRVIGFALMNQATYHETSTWHMAEFFITACYQGCGLGEKASQLIFNQYPGQWEISVLPSHTKALIFWQKVLTHRGLNVQAEEISVSYDNTESKRYLLSFTA